MNSPTISMSDIRDGDAVWCASSSERERLRQAAPQACCVVCSVGEDLEISEARMLRLEEAAAYLAACGARRLLVTQDDTNIPDGVRQSGIPTIKLQAACNADDFMSDEDSALVEERLRQLGYI